MFFLNAYRAKRYLTSRELFFNVARERRLAGTGKVFLTTNKRQFTRRKFQERFAKSAFPRESACGEKFYGRSGILPLHFCYFFPQTPSAESATEYGKLRGNAGTAGTGIFSRRSRRLRKFYGRRRVSRIQFYFYSANFAVPKALKLRERVPAMANPHKSERERERVGVKQK